MTDPIPTVIARPPRWPTPKLDKIVVDTVTQAARKPPKTRGGKLNIIKKALKLAAEELIPAAERIQGATGEEKHHAVRVELIRLLHTLEDRLNVIPNFLEPLAFRGLEMLLDGIIKQVFDQLKARGVV